MVDAKSSPVMHKVRVEAAVQDHVKAANSQMVQEQNIPGPSEHPARLSEPIDSPLLPSVEEASEDKMDMADGAAMHRYCLKKMMNFGRDTPGARGGLQCGNMPPIAKAESEEQGLVRKHRRSCRKKNMPASKDLEGEGYSDWNE
eukprot:g38323.t1